MVGMAVAAVDFDFGLHAVVAATLASYVDAVVDVGVGRADCCGSDSSHWRAA